METRPIAGAPFGVEVLGLDTGSPLSAADAAELNRLFDTRRVLLFRGEDMGAEAHVRLAEAICPILREGKGDKPYSINSPVSKDAYIHGRAGIPFHSDHMFTIPGPIQLVSLAAVQLEMSEPTMFSDSVKAFSKLPASLQQRLRGLTLVQCQAYHGGALHGRQRVRDFEHLPREQFAVSRHPAVLRHPRTGEEVLLHSVYMTSHVEGWSYEDSDELFAEISMLQYAPDNIYEHDWRVGDLMLWDNIAVQHGRRDLAASGERLLRRVAGSTVSFNQLMQGIVPAREENRAPADVA